jgi:hypothetical protein
VIRAELYRPDAPEAVVAFATWSSAGPSLEVQDATLQGLDRLFRATPVVIEDASLRQLGASGESLLQPGSLAWFRAALQTRAPELGLAVRFVAEDVRNGWDPASNYRTFREQSARLASS